MLTEKQIATSTSSEAKPQPPIFPSNSTEFVNAISHYYRAEMTRMVSWRDRLDRTTNWAIAAVAAMLSVSLSTPDSHHGVLIFAMVLVSLLLGIESRRYRFFDAYRTRVRLLERSYYARVFSPRDAIDPKHWMSHLGDDLQLPRFSLSFMEAMSRRLRRTYSWLFLILLSAWLLKTTSRIALQARGAPPSEALHSPSEFIDVAALGVLPGWAVATVILLFHLWLLYVIIHYREKHGELGYGDVHV